MTSRQKRGNKAIQLEARKQAKIEAKQERVESKAFARSIEKWRAKGAWIEETETQFNNQ